MYITNSLRLVLRLTNAWTLRKSDSDQLQSFNRVSQRRILYTRQFDHVTNLLIQELTELLNLTLVIADCHHALFVHIVLFVPMQKPRLSRLYLSITILDGDRPAKKWKRLHFRPIAGCFYTN